MALYRSSSSVFGPILLRPSSGYLGRVRHDAGKASDIHFGSTSERRARGHERGNECI